MAEQNSSSIEDDNRRQRLGRLEEHILDPKSEINLDSLLVSLWPEQANVLFYPTTNKGKHWPTPRTAFKPWLPIVTTRLSVESKTLIPFSSDVSCYDLTPLSTFCSLTQQLFLYKQMRKRISWLSTVALNLMTFTYWRPLAVAPSVRCNWFDRSIPKRCTLWSCSPRQKW